MNQFKYSVLEPYNPEIIEKGIIAKDNIIPYFKAYDWERFLKQVNENDKVYHSPSFDVETNKHILSISGVGSPQKPEFLIFYIRPKKVKTWFGFGKEKLNEEYMSELSATQTMEEAAGFLQALIDGRLDYLDNNIK